MKVEGRRAHLSHASAEHLQADRPLRLSPCGWKAGSNRIQSAGWSAASPGIIGIGKERMCFHDLERKFKFSNFFLENLALIGGHSCQDPQPTSDPERVLQ
jgi:hypothetical protein